MCLPCESALSPADDIAMMPMVCQYAEAAELAKEQGEGAQRQQGAGAAGSSSAAPPQHQQLSNQDSGGSSGQWAPPPSPGAGQVRHNLLSYVLRLLKHRMECCCSSCCTALKQQLHMVDWLFTVCWELYNPAWFAAQHPPTLRTSLQTMQQGLQCHLPAGLAACSQDLTLGCEHVSAGDCPP